MHFGRLLVICLVTFLLIGVDQSRGFDFLGRRGSDFLGWRGGRRGGRRGFDFLGRRGFDDLERLGRCRGLGPCTYGGSEGLCIRFGHHYSCIVDVRRALAMYQRLNPYNERRDTSEE